ncbi:MAG: hypothetical protein AB7D01_07875 [Methanoculleus sp.]
MSHITTIKTKVVLKDESLLREVLAGMQRTLRGFRIEETTTRDGDRQILVRYAPIEIYQTRGNLRFVLKDGAWQMQGDGYKCWNEFKAVTDQVLVGYQQAALQRVLIRNRYATTAQTVSPSCVTMHARRF